ELLAALREGVIPAAVAGRVLDLMAETGHAAADIIAREGLEQISADDDIAPVVDGILTEHPDEVAAFRGGREQVFGFLMGQVMRATQGKASPDTVRRLLRERLGE
ncbi:MAG: Asp-tRNA(Asn)/Glu-tRNA(Gln) amidotransferase GatCAB subunit B, partial [Acidobacteriota bacterium]